MELVKATSTAIDFSDRESVATLKATVAQGLTDPEFKLFAEIVKSTGLNPFKKEIWAIKAGGRLQLMTGINGYLTIANSHPQYDGMEVDVETEQGRPTKAVAKVYRKDRRFPSVGIALMSEFKKDTPIWKQMPSVMLTKVAKSIALREAFSQELGGLYTEEEMPSEYAVTKQKTVDVAPKPKPEPVNHQHMYFVPCDENFQHAEDQEKAYALYDHLIANAVRCPNADYWVAKRDLPKLKRFKCQLTEAAFAKTEESAGSVLGDDEAEWMKAKPITKQGFDPDEELAA